jgi:tRNA nucleotidyltransferase/poly(A) polymerase
VSLLIEEVMEVITEIMNPIPVYGVGGMVRDWLMDRESDDIDITTPATPEEVIEILEKRNPGRKIWETGKRFGTVATKVYLPKSDRYEKVEITTFREESYDGKTRKPNVEFVRNLHQDLMRRDFTINAIAIRLKKNRIHIIDPFGGMDDIENGIIRAVGSARQRFKEDPLRMLRAARFASTLGFEIEEMTMKRMRDASPAILKVSKERWMQELDKLLVADNVMVGLNILADTRLLNYMIPELAIQVGFDQQTPYHDFTLWEHTCRVVQAVPKDDVELAWIGLLHDVGKPFAAFQKNDEQKIYVGHELIGKELAEQIGKHLKWSADRIKNVSDGVGNHLDEKSQIKGYDSGAQKRAD